MPSATPDQSLCGQSGQEGTDCGEAPATSGGTLCTGGDTGALLLAVQWLAGTLSPILVMKQDMTYRFLNKTYNWGNASQD